jgi:hypothetical protein
MHISSVQLTEVSGVSEQLVHKEESVPLSCYINITSGIILLLLHAGYMAQTCAVYS